MSGNLKKLFKRASLAKRMIEGGIKPKPLRGVRKQLSRLFRVCGSEHQAEVDSCDSAKDTPKDAPKDHKGIDRKKCVVKQGAAPIDFDEITECDSDWELVSPSASDEKSVENAAPKLTDEHFDEVQHSTSDPSVVAARRALNVKLDVHRSMEEEHSPRVHKPTPPQKVRQQRFEYGKNVRFIFMLIFVLMLISFAYQSALHINDIKENVNNFFKKFKKTMFEGLHTSVLP